MLDQEPDYKFILDGQMSMIDDWFEQLSKSGHSVSEAKRRLRAFVQEGRLRIGPYYVQPDWQIVSGEALVRNLAIGMKMAQSLGGSMKTGWLVDNFGQISQAAQLHALCGLCGIYVWRGVYMEPEKIRSEFLWRSPDGTVLPTIYMINSYRNAMRLASKPEIVEQRIVDEVSRMSFFNTTSQVLLMNGYDQDIEPDDVISVLKNHDFSQYGLDVVQSTPEEYLEAVNAEHPELPVLEGAQYSGRYISVFPGAMSARIYLKQQNEYVQYMLERMMEPLGTLNYIFGSSYEHASYESIWKMLLKNHFHDSICGVSVDPVHADMENRFDIILRLASEHIDRSLTDLCSRIDTQGIRGNKVLVVINPSLEKRDEIIKYNDEYIAVRGIPSLGWKSVPDEGDTVSDPVWIQEGSDPYRFRAGNSMVEVGIRMDGSFDLVDKQSGRTYKKLGVLEDSGDAGDTYNYSQPDRDQIIDSENIAARIMISHSSEKAAEFRIEYQLSIPEGLSDDGKSRSKKKIELPIIQTIRIDSASEIVKIDIRLKNTAKNHVLRARFPTLIKTERSFGGSPFDVTMRPLETGDFDEEALPSHVRAVIIGAREGKSNSFFLGQGFADLNDGEIGLAVLNRGLPEYQVRRESGTIVLTLFRSVGVIATEVNTRVGDAGPYIAVPDAQCLRDLHFEYAVYPHRGSVYEGKVAHAAERFRYPVIIVETDRHHGILGSEFGEIQVLEGRIILSAFKKAENGSGVVIRFFNAEETPQRIQLRAAQRIVQAWLCNLLEERQESIPVDKDGTIAFKIGMKKIITLELILDRQSVSYTEPARADLIDAEESADFSSYPSVPVVTEHELYSELSRAALLGERMEDIMYRRPALEAKLSSILTRMRFEKQAIRHLGLELNDARVKRRLYDYIRSYLL